MTVVNYPGVYIEEIPSGVRTITGVPTSVVAFIGRAKDGPVEEPTPIFSFTEFERTFGGLWPRSSLGYAVRDFYLNAPGSQALIVRVAVTGAQPDVYGTVAVSGLTFKAVSPGTQGNLISATIDQTGITDTAAAAEAKKLFNLTIKLKDAEGKDVATESFKNVSTDVFNPRRVDAVLVSGSKLLRLDTVLDENTPRPAPGGPASPTNGAEAAGDLAVADIRRGLEVLPKADIFNLLCIPPLASPIAEDDADQNGLDGQIVSEALGLCEKRRAMFIIDPPRGWKTVKAASDRLANINDNASKNAALFFPRIRKKDSTLNDGKTDYDFAPSGAIAGVFARTDIERGVWKAPAGLDATLRGAPALSVTMSDEENGLLNPKAINCLRIKPGPTRVIWGARTRAGSDALVQDDWKYIPVRRLALFIEESLYRGTQWVVFEPNDEPLWASIRLNVGSFMHSLFRQGAFKGGSPREAYFVKCDKETTTQADINRGIVNIVVGFAPLKPVEFVIIKLQQMAGQIET